MSELDLSDARRIEAASGWIGLGLPQDARAELDQLSPNARQHPKALAVEWELCATQYHWEEALSIATRLLDADRTHPSGWVNRSFALHELRRTAEARETLLDALPLFPTLGVIPYNLACYACQLGDLTEARTWLRKAMHVEGRDLVLRRARRDPDLTPLRHELDAI